MFGAGAAEHLQLRSRNREAQAKIQATDTRSLQPFLARRPPSGG